MKQSIREIFPGIIVGNESEVIANRFTGEEILLTAEEVAVYDLSLGAELLQDYRTVEKCIDWFIKNNPAAYMTLLD
jgi:hypothetical protein